MKNGFYSYRFSGSSMKNMLPYKIEGLGTLKLTNLNISDGHHRSSILQMISSNASLEHAYFQFTGSLVYNRVEGNWSATIDFNEQNPPTTRPAQKLASTYRVVSDGKDRYWLISTGAERTESSKPYKVHELSQGELVWLGRSLPQNAESDEDS